MAEYDSRTLERLRSKIDKRGPTECWPWTASIDRGGYGRFRVKSREQPIGAHQATWIAANGPIPPGKHVLHTCDVRHCCNEAHLWLGSNAENVADKVAKGRSKLGREKRHSAAKLTDEQVNAIKANVDGKSTAALSREFGIDRKGIWQMRAGKTYEPKGAPLPTNQAATG